MIGVYEVMKHCRNFFTEDSKLKYGNYTIVNGELSLPFLYEGQYFLTEGSELNDYTVHKNATGEFNLKDETFTGYIVPCNIPQAFLDVCEKIKAYTEATGANGNAYVSESFGGYSYTKPTKANGAVAGAFDAFREELNGWRKI